MGEGRGGGKREEEGEREGEGEGEKGRGREGEREGEYNTILCRDNQTHQSSFRDATSERGCGDERRDQLAELDSCTVER